MQSPFSRFELREESRLKLAVSGKGGVGKTTIAGILARLWGRSGVPVLVVDADPSPNLASTLGIPRERRERITPLSRMLDLIEERTGVRPGTSYGSMFRLNPKVDDLVDLYGVDGKDNVRLLVLGTIESGGSGCFCPESALLRRLMKHLLFEREEPLIIDMEAGVEHLGRGTAENVDLMLIIVEPGMRSLETARRIRDLSFDIGIPTLSAVANKIRSNEEILLLKSELDSVGIELLGTVPYDPELVSADLRDVSPLDLKGELPSIEAIAALQAKLEEKLLTLA